MDKLQQKLLEMIKWFHDYCEKNNLTYYVVSGTMLGAVRHQGFIPWDDDIDVGMPRKDYDKLMSMLTDVEDHYILETPYTGNRDYCYDFCKIYDTRNNTSRRCEWESQERNFS